MTREDYWSPLGMSTCKVLHVCLYIIVAVIILSPVLVQGQDALRILYTETPSNVSSRTNATFGFNVLGDNATDPCSSQSCSIRCKVDQNSYKNCSTRRASFTNLDDGGHIFYVSVNTTGGASVESKFSWTVDTVAPTAVVDGGQAFTNAQNVTVNVTFSEVCGGFVCTNKSFCDLVVHGDGAVIPSTFKEIQKGRIYSLVVALFTNISSGKANAVIARDSCADAAGNLLQRTNESSFTIRFDRTVPSVNLWTAIPSSEVTINNQPRTCQATDKDSDLRIYLDFDTPVSSSAEELQHLLSVSNGTLTPSERKSLGNRRFGFMLSNITNVSEVTIGLAGDKVANRYGTLIPVNSSTTFLYDNVRPQAQLSTTSRAKTKNSIVPFVLQFTEAVFGFNSSGVTVLGGTVTSFKEIAKSIYTFEVKTVDDNLVTVVVAENRSTDIAGNANLASSTIQVQHYTTPSISVVLYSLISVGFVSTALVAALLSISSETLAAAGAALDRGTGSIANPSRNLLGLACHLQVLALSGWLGVSLPIEYQEVANGLRWLIPHLDCPWQHDHVTNTCSSNCTTTSMLQKIIKGRRRLLAVEERLGLQHIRRGRFLGANATLYGPALGPGDYELYFLNQTSGEALLKSVENTKYIGWQDFERNIFWMAVVGGSLILLHCLIHIVLRWRTKAPIRGALIFPRFELYLFILAIPGICQAAAFLIRGQSAVGIAVGSLVLAIPAAFLVSVIIFLIYGIFTGALVQYKEFRYEVQRHGYVQPQSPHGLVSLVAGTGIPGKWVRNNRLATTFLPRYGLLFEDHKGPPRILVHKKHNLSNSIKRSGSTMENADSDDENDVVKVSDSHRILGDAQAAYIVLELSRRITLGLMFGFYRLSDRSWSQVGVVLGITVLQLVYLVAVKPFRKRGVQLVETIALLCEVGIFVAAIALLARGHSTDKALGVAIFMLSLIGISFIAQLVNEWYALLEQLLHLSTAQEPTLKSGLEKLAGGLVLLFTPRRTWPRFIGPPPPSPASSVAVSTPISDSHPAQVKEINVDPLHRPNKISRHQGRPFALPEPLALPNPDAVVPTSQTGPFTDLKSIAQITAIDVDSGPQSEEIQPEPSPSPGSARQSRSHWSSLLAVEGRRSRASSREGNSEELKMLRELARASFPRRGKDGGFDIEEGSVLSTPMEGSTPIVSPRDADEKRYVLRRRQFNSMPHPRSMESNTYDSIFSVATLEGDTLQEDPLSVPEIANLVGPPTFSTSSSRSFNKGSGHLESHSMNLREPKGAVRPLEER